MPQAWTVWRVVKGEHDATHRSGFLRESDGALVTFATKEQASTRATLEAKAADELGRAHEFLVMTAVSCHPSEDLPKEA